MVVPMVKATMLTAVASDLLFTAQTEFVFLPHRPLMKGSNTRHNKSYMNNVTF